MTLATGKANRLLITVSVVSSSETKKSRSNISVSDNEFSPSSWYVDSPRTAKVKFKGAPQEQEVNLASQDSSTLAIKAFRERARERLPEQQLMGKRNGPGSKDEQVCAAPVQWILDCQKEINKRMCKRISRWARRHWATTNTRTEENDFDVAPAEEASHFPNGFGFFLCPEQLYSRTAEPELSILYDTIMLLNDRETQDKLLCFLDDFRRQSSAIRFMRKRQHARHLLKEVMNWMRVQRYNRLFWTNNDLNVKAALLIEARLKAHYMTTVAWMGKLLHLRKQMDGCRTLKNRKQSSLTKKRSNAQEEGPANTIVAYMLERITKDRIQADQERPPRLNNLERKLNNISRFIGLQERAAELLREEIGRRKRECNLLTKWQKNAEEEMISLQTRLYNLQNFHPVSKRSRAVISLGTAQVSAQTVSVSRTSPKTNRSKTKVAPSASLIKPLKVDSARVLKVPPSASLSKLLKADSTRVLTPKATTDDHGLPTDMPDPDFRPECQIIIIDDIASPDAGAETLRQNQNTSANAKPNGSQNIQPEQVFEVKESTSSDFFSSSPSSSESLSYSSDDDTQDRGFAESPSTSGEGTLSDYEEPEGCPDELHSRLDGLMFQFLDDSVRHLSSLEGLLIRQRDEARMATKEAESRERSVRDLVDRFQPVLDALETRMTDFPRMEVLQDLVNVRNRVPLPHKCRACTCHNCKTSVTMETRETAAAARTTLSHCNLYTALLISVRFRYSAIIKRLYNTQEYSHKCLQHLLWGKPSTDGRWGVVGTDGLGIDGNRNVNNESGNSVAVEMVQHHSDHTAAGSAPDKDQADPLVFQLQRKPMAPVRDTAQKKISVIDNLLVKRSASSRQLLDRVKSLSVSKTDVERSTSAMLDADDDWMEALRQLQLGRLEKEADLKILDTVDILSHLPDDTWGDQVKKAQAVNRGVDLLTRLLLQVLGQTRAQLQDCRAQVQALCDIQRQLELTFKGLQVAGLELARVRCDGKFLTTGRALKNSQCRYCRCYNSPFYDNLRNIVAPAGWTRHPAKASKRPAKDRARPKSARRGVKSRVSKKKGKEDRKEEEQMPPATAEELESCWQEHKQSLVQTVAFLNLGPQAVLARFGPPAPLSTARGSFPKGGYSLQPTESVRGVRNIRKTSEKPGIQALIRAYAKIKAVSALGSKKTTSRVAPPPPLPGLEIWPPVLALPPNAMELVDHARYAVTSVLNTVYKFPREQLAERPARRCDKDTTVVVYGRLS